MHKHPSFIKRYFNPCDQSHSQHVDPFYSSAVFVLRLSLDHIQQLLKSLFFSALLPPANSQKDILGIVLLTPPYDILILPLRLSTWPPSFPQTALMSV